MKKMNENKSLKQNWWTHALTLTGNLIIIDLITINFSDSCQGWQNVKFTLLRCSNYREMIFSSESGILI